MKKLFPGVLLLFAAFSSFAQDPALKPFYHGVASGDALSDRVMIWTRVTPDVPGEQTVNWLIATDTLFTDIVGSGTATTDSTIDYTVKVDVTDLQPDTWYYYIFKHEGKNSLIGRTKTLPEGDNARIRLAVVSCARMGNGDYYNSYLSLARRNDIHAVVHLGDYIYESGGGVTSGEGNEILPNTETITLDDYRARYNTYRLDPQLRRIHQQYPFYTVWDDHETTNNSWEHGADNHTPGAEGDWEDRKNYGKQANFEWLPKREQSPGDYTIYQRVSIGNLADLILLDTRLEGRSEQVGTTNTAGRQDTNRTILGTTQMSWFKDELSNSTARWRIVGQQVMIAPVTIFGTPINADQWDGYEADRNRVINHVLSNDIENVVFLTGDIHSSWACDIPGAGYNASTGAGSAFVEFVAPSITTSGVPFSGVESLVMSANPHIKYVDLSQHGYMILDIDTGRAQADWTYVSTITSSTFTEIDAASWYVNQEERFVREASSPIRGYVNSAPFAPLKLDTTSVSTPEVSISKGITVYPNPFENSVFIRVNDLKERTVVVRVHNVLGKLLSETTVPASPNIKMDLPDLQRGTYLLSVYSGEEEYKTRIVKVQ